MARKGYNITSLRNLPQYRGLTDQEFEEAVKGVLTEEAAELAQEYYEKLKEDYVLDDLKANDKFAVEILSYLYAQIHYNQDKINRLQSDISEDKLADPTKGISVLVADIEKLTRSAIALENQLGISRTVRMKEEGEDIVELVRTVRERAEKYLENKLHYILCPKCHMLLGNVWVLYRTTEGAYELKFVCKKEEKGKVCNTEVIIKPGDLNERTAKAIR